MRNPTARDIPALAESLRSAAAWLEQRGEAALKATSTQLVLDTPDRTESPVERPTGPADPTWGAVMRDDSPAPAENAALLQLVDDQAQLVRSVRVVWAECGEMIAAGERIHGAIKPVRTGPPTVMSCATRKCEDPASPGCSGRCAACYQWRRRWSADHNGEPPPEVPEDLLERRRKLAENRKVHVNGPFASEAS